MSITMQCRPQYTVAGMSRAPGNLSGRLHAGRSHPSRKYRCVANSRVSECKANRHLTVFASSAQADEPSLVRQARPSWNYKLGAVYQHLLPGPLLFLPSLLQPVSTIISLEGALHGHEWLHWLLSLLPVPQVPVQAVNCCCICCHFNLSTMSCLHRLLCNFQSWACSMCFTSSTLT